MALQCFGANSSDIYLTVYLPTCAPHSSILLSTQALCRPSVEDLSSALQHGWAEEGTRRGPQNPAAALKQARRRGGIGHAQQPFPEPETPTDPSPDIQSQQPGSSQLLYSPAPSTAFVNPYSVGELELIRQLYSVTTARVIRDRSWSVQLQQPGNHVYLYMAKSVTSDPGVEKTNAGAIVYSQKYVERDAAAEAFLISLKPKEPLVSPAVNFRVFALPLCTFDNTQCQPERLRQPSLTHLHRLTGIRIFTMSCTRQHSWLLESIAKVPPKPTERPGKAQLRMHPAQSAQPTTVLQ